MSDKNAYDWKKYICCLCVTMCCPCTMPCTMPYLNSVGKTPNDAEKLSPEEAKKYVDQLQGIFLF